MHPLALLLAVALHAVLAMPTQAAPAPLAASSWAVTELAGNEMLDGHPVTFVFDTEGNINGDASCNRFGGSCSFDGDKLTISRIRSTRRACERPVMDQERTFLRLLGAVQNWAITADDKLVLRGPEGVIKAKRQPEDAAHDGE
jgi:heat shock protein HslJ